MMFNFPFYPYHHSRYYPHNKSYPHMQYNDQNYQNNYIDKNQVFNQSKSQENKQESKQTHDITNNNNDGFVFDIFGLKLYYDDILLICLIFFLYNEGIKDESLFIILILLLLS